MNTHRQSKRKAQKQKERERRVRSQREELSDRRSQRELDRLIRRKAPFPDPVIDSTAASPDIIEFIAASLDRLKNTYTRQLRIEAITLLSDHSKQGWTDIINERAARLTNFTRDRVEIGLTQLLELDLGDALLACAPPNLVRRALPMNCFSLRPLERQWEIKCRSLLSVKTSAGLVYQSPHKPTITLDGRPLQAVFSHHALLQLAERVLPKWQRQYIGQIHVFGFFYECVHFGVTTLLNKQPALVIYNSFARVGDRVKEVLKKLPTTDGPEQQLYYRIGYCPLTIDGQFAIAKTFLTPGYWHTPERQTLSLPGDLGVMRNVEQACDDGINTLSIGRCPKTREAITWFHTHGVPQVERMEHEVFRDIRGPYSWTAKVAQEMD